MAVACGHLRIGAGNADGRNVRVRKILAAGNGDAGTVGTQHDCDVCGNQLLRGRGRLVGGRAVVSIDEFDIIGLSANLNRGVDLVGILHAEHFLFSAGAAVAGSRLKHTDLDDVVTKDQHREQQTQTKCQYEQFPHLNFISFWIVGKSISAKRWICKNEDDKMQGFFMKRAKKGGYVKHICKKCMIFNRGRSFGQMDDAVRR